MTPLRGMTWNHPRGYDPMVAVSADWEKAGNGPIKWEKRSLQDFESYPVEELARKYDIIVIDHPHVGEITAKDSLLALPHDPALAAASVGLSYPSYTWDGRQWAYPIDAAAQVQAVRSELLGQPLADWAGVLRLARQGRVAIPLRAPHSLMSFLTLVANAGHPCRNDGPGQFVDRDAGIAALERLATLAELVDPACFGWDPIDVLERMATGDDIACSPLIYGYVSYSRDNAPGKRVSFHDIPQCQPGAGVSGSALGGTGIAVSAYCKDPEAAIAFARHIAGSSVQRGRYSAAGGQVGHLDAWRDSGVDGDANGFYSGTIRTLQSASLRPRHAGYMTFQQAASAEICAALDHRDFLRAIARLDELFIATFKAA